MNPFNDSILRDTFKYLINPITLNPEVEGEEYSIKGLVTNAKIRSSSHYHLHSDSLFMRGDFLKKGEDYYLVTGDVIQERGSKYKAEIEYCNYTNKIVEKVKDKIIGYRPNGQPIWSYVDKVVELYVGVIKNENVIVSTTSEITVANNEIKLIIKNNTTNKAYFTVNKEITIDGEKWLVREVMTFKQGLLELTLMRKP